MAFKDIPYQTTASAEVIDLLDDAWEDYERSREKVAQGKRSKPSYGAVYLAALTGAGKTVIAARVLNQILDRGDAAVLWLSDSPSLNAQTRDKLSALIEPSRLKIIDKVSVNYRMEPGYVYFLNPQKLGAQKKGGKGEQEMLARWRFVVDAIVDPLLRLYVVQDEAHRGISKAGVTAGRDAIMTALVEATSEHMTSAHPVPVVLGLSATPQRFKDLMKRRRRLEGHTVDPKDIQESGLVKRDIDFRVPAEITKGDKDNREAQLGMLDSAVAELHASSQGWAKFHAQESAKEGYAEQQVVPLLLFQVQDNITDAKLGEYLTHLNDSWIRYFGHALPGGTVVHAMQAHTTIQAGEFEVPYCPPEQVEATRTIRVLVAKLAVSTGWDCPRAEVMFSLRPGQDETYIAQLVGRMVRMPLAERSLSAELDFLNVSRVLLPFFNHDTVERVVKGVRGESLPSQVGFDMVAVKENPDLLSAYGTEPFDLVSSLTKAPAPSQVSDPVVLMSQLAVMVGADGLPGVEDDPVKASKLALFSALDDCAVGLSAEIAAAGERLGMRVEERAVAQNWVLGGGITSQQGDVALDATSRVAKVSRLVASLPGGIGSEYIKQLRSRGMGAAQARDQAANLAQLPDALAAVEGVARARSKDYLEKVRVVLETDEGKPAGEQQILESRRNEYRRRMAQFGDPVPERLGTLGPRQASFGKGGQKFTNGWPKHLLVESEGDGLYRMDVSSQSWEKQVLDYETKKESVVGWYRNPGSGREFTLQVPWRDGETWRSAHPDFVLIEKVGEELRPSVVDPHDPDRDGLGRLRGLADHTVKYGSEYHRMWAVGNAQSGSHSLRYLDLQDAKVREAIQADGADVHDLYTNHGKSYGGS